MRLPVVSITLLVVVILSACLSVALHQGESRVNTYENIAYAFGLASVLAAQIGY